ncbi:MAG TPA: 3-ketoacyl-ACP reductase [Vicinamibacterales bacterium]|nr:3-ketoacyl-ACP reductase [Vicinamibacterales bacterium]
MTNSERPARPNEPVAREPVAPEHVAREHAARQHVARPAHSTSHVALVTGGTRGIGLGIAESLAHDGWHLALCGVRGAAEVADVLGRFAGRADYFQADISSREDRACLVQWTAERFPGRLHALVNNAGRAPRVRADLLDATEDSFRELIETNLGGPYFLTQAIARQMLATRTEAPDASGGIVFLTSVSAEMASVNRGDYCVSKAGLAMAAKLFAVRLAPEGIPVYDVRPGIIATDMTSAVRDVYDTRIAEGLVPQRRWGQPADVGRVVAALLRGDVPYATGSVTHVDGGLAIPRL